MRFASIMRDVGSDRPGLERLAEDECWAFLAARRLGRVALVQLGRPIIFPVNYAVDGRSIVFRTAPGTKLIAAGNGCVAAFEVDEASEDFEHATSVIVHGSLREITSRSERERLRQLGIRAWAPGTRDHFVAVEPRWVSGRRILDVPAEVRNAG